MNSISDGTIATKIDNNFSDVNDVLAITMSSLGDDGCLTLDVLSCDFSSMLVYYPSIYK